MAETPLSISSKIVQDSLILQEERRSYFICQALLILPYVAPLPDLRVGASLAEACGRVDLYCAWRLARASSTAVCFDTVFSWEGGDMIEAHKEANKSIASPITSSDAHYALARFAGL